MTNLIEERNERTKERKKRKKQMDSIITLSHNEEGNVMHLSSKMTLADTTIRLLDEGFCDNGFVLKKGTIEKYLNGQNEVLQNLTDDFIGNVNLGHMDFATFPYVIGEWKKEDLSLVDIENDRKALDISVRLDADSVFVRELARQPYDIGVSAEFYYHINDEDTEELSEMMGTYLPVIDEIFIFAYGLVGECGNVNSSGLELKGATMSKPIKELMAEEQVDIELELENEDEVLEELEELEEKLDEEIKGDGDEAEEEVAEELSADEEVIEESEESDEEDEEDAGSDACDEEDEVEEDGGDSADDEDEVDEVEDLAEALAFIKALKAENEGLKDIIAELKKKNRKNAKKLARELDAKEKFLAMTKELSVELFENEGEAERQEEEEAKKLADARKYYKGDGIAD